MPRARREERAVKPMWAKDLEEKRDRVAGAISAPVSTFRHNHEITLSSGELVAIDKPAALSLRRRIVESVSK